MSSGESRGDSSGVERRGERQRRGPSSEEEQQQLTLIPSPVGEGEQEATAADRVEWDNDVKGESQPYLTHMYCEL